MREITITTNPRVPRPLGITYQAIQLRKETNPDKQLKIKEKLIANMIDQYVSNNQYLSNRYVSIDDIALFLGIGTYDVMRLMNKSLERLNRFFDNQAGENSLARVMILGLLKKSQEAQVLAERQAHILLASQGGVYKPFISGEVNKALKNLMDSGKPILETLKALQEKQSDNIFTPSTTQTNTQNNIYITTTEASKMLTEKPIPTLLTDESLLLGIGEDLKDLPDVNAKSQDLTSIGIKYRGPQSLSEFKASEEAKIVK